VSPASPIETVVTLGDTPKEGQTSKSLHKFVQIAAKEMDPSENTPNLHFIRSTSAQVVATEPTLSNITEISSMDSTNDDDRILDPALELGGQQNLTAEPPANLVTLPHDVLLIHVMSFLDYRNAFNLSHVNSLFRATLSLSILHAPEPLLQQRTWYGGQGETRNAPRRSARIPILLPHRTHSVVLTCQWNDSFYGNQKGALFVVAVAVHDKMNMDTLSSIENGQVVYESPPAPHKKTTLVMSFSYSPSKAYFLWYRLGGGHQLCIENLFVQTVIYDHADRSLLNMYDALKEQTESVFYLNLLRATAHSLLVQLENGQEPDSRIVMGIRVTATSMMAMEELAMALLNTKQGQNQAHSMLPGQNVQILDPSSFAIGIAYINASW
jgi:hypothetical protein